MTIAIRSSSKVSVASGGATSAVITVPAGTVDGDELILFAGPTYNTHVLTDPAGWTALGSTSTNGSYGMKSYRRVASSEPANYTLSWANNTQDLDVVMVCLQNPDASTPYDSTAGNSAINNGSSTTAAGTAIVTTHPNEMVVCGYHFKNASAFTPAAGQTLAQNASASSAFSLVVTYGLQASAGTTGTEAATLGTASVNIVQISAYNSSLITPQFWNKFVKSAEVDS